MQKKLIALAIAGLASTATFAQTNVTIYGVVDASVDLVDAGDTPLTSSQRTNRVSSNESFIGFRGTEDLGDGLKAVFQIETDVNSDGSGAASNSSRNTFVGLASDSWGRVILGQYDTPYKTSTRSYDLFADHLADNRNIMGNSAVGAGTFFEARQANTVRYDSAEMNGFKFALAYIAGGEAATTNGTTKGSGYSASGTYDINNEWSVAAAYERHKFGTVGTGSLGAIGGAAADQTEKAWKLGTSYKSGAWRAAFAYEKLSNDFTAGVGDHKAWTLGGGYTMGSNEFKVAYTKANDFQNVGSSSAKQWALGVDHVMSKRTKVYAEYVKLKNDAAAAYGLGAWSSSSAVAVPAGGDSDPSAWQFGVRHAF